MLTLRPFTSPGRARALIPWLLALTLLLYAAPPGRADETMPPDPPPGPFAELVVGTVNLYRPNAPEERRADILRAVEQAASGIVGWQEANGSHGLLTESLTPLGWESYLPPTEVEVPISWDAERFELLGSATQTMHPGMRRKRVRFPTRYLTRVDLRDRASDTTVTVFNTHVNQRIEKYTRRATTGRPRPGEHWNHANRHLGTLLGAVRAASADVVLVTGDFNVDAAADLRVRHASFPTRRYAGALTSNWARLGLTGGPTFREPSGKRPRYIDYVWQGRQTTAATMDRQWSVGGLSDHRQLFVRLAPA